GEQPGQHRYEPTQGGPGSPGGHGVYAPPAPQPRQTRSALSARTPRPEPYRLSAPNQPPRQPSPQVKAPALGSSPRGVLSQVHGDRFGAVPERIAHQVGHHRAEPARIGPGVRGAA